jgi:hypothetical protein
MNIFANILTGIVLFAHALFGGVAQPVNTPTLGSVVPQAQALFETSLQSSITANATSAVLVSGTDFAGNALNGYYCFTIDSGQPNVEFTCGNVSGTAMSNMVRGVNPALGITSNPSLEYSHRRGADVKQTDAPYISIYSNILNGTQTLPAPLVYDPSLNTVNAPSSPSIVPNWGQVTSYVSGVATSGAPDAGMGSKGLVNIASPTQIASGTATTTDGAQTLWNVVSAGQYGKSYGATPTVTTDVYGSATGTASNTASFSYSYSGSIGSFSLPTPTDPYGRTITGVTSSTLVVTLNGAQGQTGNAVGGEGGQVIATINNPATGTTYYYNIGGQNGYDGGGAGGAASAGGKTGGYGGGMTWFSANSTYSSANVLAVAAGGGGGGDFTGGAGGGTSGSSGGGNCSGRDGCPGGGGSQSSGGGGGSGGVSSGGTGTSGTTAQGGIGGNAYYSGGTLSGAGGGGAGYYGGGGGGGSGYNGGAGLSGSGGGGSSYVAASLTSTSTTANVNSGNGNFNAIYTYTYTWSSPSESVSSTVAGNNFGGTVTVSAPTTHLDPTTSTINFAPWNFPVAGVACTANAWSLFTPSIVSETTSSVQFLFSSAIAGNKYNYACVAY